MTKKTLYSTIAILILIGVFAYDLYFDKQAEYEVVLKGSATKNDTNLFFLPSSTTGQIVHHDGYSLSYSEVHEQAEWVAYELKKAHLENTNYKRPYFEIDHSVKTKAAHWRNYKNSGYDRGHLCPAGDKKYSQAAHDETFLTSNISPQRHDFNSGVWNRLEQKTRYWAGKYDGVFVISGGVLSEGLETIGDEKVAVPNMFYKILIDANNKPIKALGFLLPHEDSDEPLWKFVTSIDTIEVLTGIDFFPELNDAIENKIEASSDYKNWSF
jgi:endonuclease G